MRLVKRKRAVRPRFVYRGFGFPVLLLGVPMVQVRGRWTPDVNYEELRSLVLETLAEKPGCLTGHEVRFVRLAHDLTLTAFAARFGVTHPAVLKWERAGGRPSGMSWSTEKDIRLFVLSRRPSAPKRFLDSYHRLEEKPRKTSGRISVDTFGVA